ncbi:MAG: class I SAM-dependent methyltransferase [Pseudomonadota bacterium]
MTTARIEDRAAQYRRLLGDQHQRQEGLRRGSAERIVGVLREYVIPVSALDVGCGTGSFLAALEGSGVTDLQGIEGPWIDPAMLCIAADRVGTWDLEKPFDLGRRYDLVVSMEVAEHLAPDRADGFVADLVRHGDVVLFSAAVPFQGGAGHVNERWPSCWAEKFAGHGFVPVDLFRPRLWEDTTVLWWLRQNLLLYVHSRRLSSNPRLAAVYREGRGKMPLDVVHPVLLAQYALRAESSADPVQRVTSGQAGFSSAAGSASKEGAI